MRIDCYDPFKGGIIENSIPDLKRQKSYTFPFNVKCKGRSSLKGILICFFKVCKRKNIVFKRGLF